MCEEQPKLKRKELLAKIDELEKEVERQKERSDGHWRSYQESQKEIEEVHQVLDGFGLDICPRKVEDLREYHCGEVTLSLQARFLRYLQSLIQR